jgi:26S proteasome regulatory subunit N11
MSCIEVGLTCEITDIEDIGQQLLEDNIVSVSRQMIDKEASVPTGKQNTTSQTNGHANGGMEVDEEL